MAPRPSIHDIKQHDTLPGLQVQVIDRTTSEPYDLTDLAYARFRLYEDTAERLEVVDSAAAVIEPPEDGVILYSFFLADTGAVGTFLAELRLVWNDGRALTVPAGFVHVKVHPSLGDA